MHILTWAFGKILKNKFFLSEFLGKICFLLDILKIIINYTNFSKIKKKTGSKCLEKCNKKIMLISFIVSEKKEHKL